MTRAPHDEKAPSRRGELQDSEAESSHPRPALPPADRWLVDGYNVLHAVLLGGESREDWWRAEQRQRLIDRACHFRGSGTEIFVVFDGDRPGGDDPADPRVQVVFAASADDWLVERARRCDVPGGLAVVTADRKVAGRCRHAGAVVVSPRDFLAHCAAPEDEAPGDSLAAR